MHIFCHRSLAYAYETNGDSNWMGRHFFTGGMMLSDDLLLRYPAHCQIEKQWNWSGTHYRRTAESWLANLDTCQDAVFPVLEHLGVRPVRPTPARYTVVCSRTGSRLDIRAQSRRSGGSEDLTGMELDERGTVRPLGEAEWVELGRLVKAPAK